MAKKKKAGRPSRRVSKVSNQSAGGLNALTTSQLRQELARRSRQRSTLERKRDKLIAQLRDIEAQLAELGAAATAGGGGRTRPKNEMNLEDALVKTLGNKTMSVTDLAEAVQRDGYTTHSANFRTIVNQALIRSKKFKKVSRGQYTTA